MFSINATDEEEGERGTEEKKEEEEGQEEAKGEKGGRGQSKRRRRKGYLKKDDLPKKYLSSFDFVPGTISNAL